MDSVERGMLIELMADMIRQEVSDPMERLLDRLIALLLFSGAIRIDDLGDQMRQALAELPEQERDTAGAKMLAKYGRLGIQPSEPPPSPDSAATPDWFRGLIDGGKG